MYQIICSLKALFLVSLPFSLLIVVTNKPELG